MEKIVIGSYLENTRMLFDFMEELNGRWTHEKETHEQMYNGEGGLIRRQEILNNLNMWITDKIKKSKMGELYQNPLSGYIRFYKKLFSLEGKEPDEFAEHITPMLNYFNILDYLTQKKEEHEKNSGFGQSLPYYFEDLCLTIMQLSECYSCSILYHQNSEQIKIISRNGAIVDSNDMIACVNMVPLEFDSIVRAYNSSQKPLEYNMTTAKGVRYNLTFSESTFFKDSVKGIKTITARAKSDLAGNSEFYHDYLVFEFPYFGFVKDDKAQKSFFLILDYHTEFQGKKNSYEILPKVLKILFLRNRLWTTMDENYAKLIQMRYDCSYIKSLIKKEDKYGVTLEDQHEENSDLKGYKKQRTAILHVSDIHLINERQWDTPRGDIVIKIKTAVKDQMNKVDLMAITGDVVQGSTNASDAQEKYSKVAALLKELAVVLWAQECMGKMVLPHDWKRRILIVPGNHDYSTMSDVVVETYSRRIKSGFPATRSGGTMSKLTYYIEFLVNFLDVPMDELLENDMNEIRDYDKLNVLVGLFNTVSKVNSLQTNKVAFNKEKLERLMESKKWSDMQPETPNGSASVRVQQEEQAGGGASEGKTEKQKKSGEDKKVRVVLMHHSPEYKINYFDDKYEYYNYPNVENLYNEYCYLLYKWLEDPEGASAKYSCRFDQFKNQINTDKYDPKFLKSELYADMNTLIKIYEDTLPDDEFYADFISKHKTTKRMQESDEIIFRDICKKHIKDGDIVLAGHVHRNCYQELEGKEPGIYIAPKLYDNYYNRISYSVISEDISKDDYQTTVYRYDVNGTNRQTRYCPCAYFLNNKECTGHCT